MNLYEIASFVIYALLAMFILLGSAWLCLDIFNRIKDSIRPMIINHGKSIALKIMSLPFRMSKKIGAKMFWLSMWYAMTAEEKRQHESNNRVQELKNKLQELNMLAVYLTNSTPWPVFPEDRDDAYVDNAMEHYHGELEGTRDYIQDTVTELYNAAIPEEWDRALQAIVNRYGHNVADSNINWYEQPTDEEIAEQYKMYLLNCVCVNEVTGTVDLILCQQCIPNCAENIRVDKFGTDMPCYICGHKNGEEFPDINKEE